MFSLHKTRSLPEPRVRVSKLFCVNIFGTKDCSTFFMASLVYSTSFCVIDKSENNSLIPTSRLPKLFQHWNVVLILSGKQFRQHKCSL